MSSRPRERVDPRREERKKNQRLTDKRTPKPSSSFPEATPTPNSSHSYPHRPKVTPTVLQLQLQVNVRRSPAYTLDSLPEQPLPPNEPSLPLFPSSEQEEASPNGRGRTWVSLLTRKRSKSKRKGRRRRCEEQSRTRRTSNRWRAR